MIIRLGLIVLLWYCFLHRYPLTDSMGHLLWDRAFVAFVAGIISVFILVWKWFRG